MDFKTQLGGEENGIGGFNGVSMTRERHQFNKFSIFLAFLNEKIRFDKI
jgi:hypothetical protein